MYKLLLIVAVVAIIFSANYKITKTYSDGKEQVAGISAFASDETPILVSDEGKNAIARNDIGALIPISLPVSIEDDKVTAGDKTLVFLPDQAVKNAQASRVISEVKNANIGKTKLASINRVVSLEQRGEVLGYSINGYKKHKIVGVLPVNTDVRAFVSAENGQVVETEQSLLGRILNKVAP